MKVAIYTCITGEYDNLAVPVTVDPRLDYFFFTDKSRHTEFPWNLVAIDLPQLCAKDKNRFVKMHPHKFLSEYDITIYIDGSIQIVGDIYSLILHTVNSKEEIFLYEHPERNCIFREGMACAHYSHDWIWTIASQMRKYRKDGYPADNGLFEAGVIIRKNTNTVSSLMNMWWNEYCSGAKRDQLSLPVIAWRLGVPLGSLGKSDFRCEQRYFKFTHHLRRWSLKLTLRKYLNRVIASLISYPRLFNVSLYEDRK